MIIATIVTPWILESGVYSPKLLAEFPLPPGSSCMDVTSQQNIIPDPNVYIVEVITTEEYVDAAEQAGYVVITAETEGSAV